jgi:hypothetical protein
MLATDQHATESDRIVSMVVSRRRATKQPVQSVIASGRFKIHDLDRSDQTELLFATVDFLDRAICLFLGSPAERNGSVILNYNARF